MIERLRACSKCSANREHPLNEADIQVLASIWRAELEGESSDHATLERSSDRYWKYLEDWSGSWQRLLDEGLIHGDASGYALTDLGRPLAEHYYAERPDRCWYYYEHYYPAAHASNAHSKLCERAFGKDLTQDGQVDMDSLHDMCSYMDLKDTDRILDLGCGAGALSEYISDLTGAHVTGLEYAKSAVATAISRTTSKCDRLSFVHGDMNALELPEQSFDKIISLDTIYWAADIDTAVASLVRLIKPSGKLAMFITVTPELEDRQESYEPDGTWVALSLIRLGLEYDVYDSTASFLKFWPRLKRIALELRDDFVAEGNEVIFDCFIFDADGDYLPAAAAGKLRRYLYVVNV